MFWNVMAILLITVNLASMLAVPFTVGKKREPLSTGMAVATQVVSLLTATVLAALLSR